MADLIDKTRVIAIAHEIANDFADPHTRGAAVAAAHFLEARIAALPAQGVDAKRLRHLAETAIEFCNKGHPVSARNVATSILAALEPAEAGGVEAVAAALWKAEATDAGAPPSVAAARTPEAFADESDVTRAKWMKLARAAVAALDTPAPALMAELVEALPDIEPRTVGSIGNYYGGLMIMAKDGQPFWCIENWDGYGWEPCPRYVFDALAKLDGTP